MFNIKWAYGFNQWNRSSETSRKEQMERAFKVASICSCDAIELKVGSGRMDPIGRPEWIDRSFGSWERFLLTLHECGLEKAVSWFYDPTLPYAEEGVVGRDTTNPDEADGIVEALRPFAAYLKKLGGEYLTVRPVGSYVRVGALDDEKIKNIGACWSKVGAMAKEYGIKVAMHIDWANAIHTEEEIAKLLAASDPETTGLCIDTAEYAFAGMDPVEMYKKYADRVILFHFKDVKVTAPEGYYNNRLAEMELRRAYGLWFHPMGEGGLVDFVALVKEMKAREYNGWVIVESDQSPNTAEAAMLNNWYIKKVLSKI